MLIPKVEVLDEPVKNNDDHPILIDEDGNALTIIDGVKHSRKSNRKRLECQHCGRSYRCQKSLDKHVEAKHINPKIQIFPCAKCGDVLHTSKAR